MDAIKEAEMTPYEHKQRAKRLAAEKAAAEAAEKENDDQLQKWLFIPTTNKL